MDKILFIVAQISGLAAFFMLYVSFQKNKKSSLLRYQTISSLLYALQYICLGAYAGFFSKIVSGARNIVFAHYEGKKVPIYWLFVMITIMLILSYFSYTGLISLIPIIASLSYGISLWQNNLKIIRFVEVLGCMAYIFYNIIVGAYGGLVATIVEMSFALIAIYKFDIKSQKVDNSVQETDNI